MKNKKIYLLIGAALISSSILMNAPVNVAALESGHTVVQGAVPVYQVDSKVLENKGIDVTSDVLDKLTSETQTIVMKFKAGNPNPLQALFGISNGNAGYRNNYFSIFMRDSGEIGVEIRDAQKGINYLFARPASLWGTHKGESVENTAVFVADANSKTYTMYVNGTKVFSEQVDRFLPLTNIEGRNKVSLGSVIREGQDDYVMKGEINRLEMYNQAISADEVSSIPLSTPYRLIFQSGDATQANYFRIPTLYTLESGRVLSSIDARYGGTHDSRSKINIATAFSDDNGNTWSSPTFAMKFNDYAEQIIEWPRNSNLKNSQISGSASFIDSAIVQDKSTGKVVLLADVMPAGIGNNNANKSDSGFKEIDGKYYVKLKKGNESAFNYSIRENNVIYDDVANKPTVYSVNEKYEVLENGNPLSVEQYSVNFEEGKLSEHHNGNQVPMNIFYRDSLFKVAPTNYIGVTTSENQVETWSAFKLMPPMLGTNHNATYLSPGQGLYLSHKNRIIFATYTGGELTYLISDDGATSWHKASAPIPFKNATAEAQMVELREGVIRTFFRTTTGKVAYMTSYDAGDTWSSVEYIDAVEQTGYGTQVSVIKYSQKIDGKDAVILSTPNSKSGRKGGELVVGLINPEDDSIDWHYHYKVDLPTYGYAYSAITELPNHRIGLLFEKYDSWSRNELHVTNVNQFIELGIEDILK